MGGLSRQSLLVTARILLKDTLAATCAGFGAKDVVEDRGLKLVIDICVHHHKRVVVLHLGNISVATLLFILMSDEVALSLSGSLFDGLIVQILGLVLPESLA